MAYDNDYIQLSASSIAEYENCPFSFYLSRVLRVKSEETSANLVFGSAYAHAMEHMFINMCEGKSFDPEAAFLSYWRDELDKYSVSFSSTTSPEKMVETGKALTNQMYDAWVKTGMQLMMDKHGKPMVERRLTLNLGEGVVVVAKIDLATVTTSGFGAVVDAKTPKKCSGAGFAAVADQLTIYQLAMMANKELLGLMDVEFLGYWEHLKRNVPVKANATGPEILPIDLVPKRTIPTLQRFLAKVHRVANDIRGGRFPQTPRMAWNSPCEACSLQKLCHQRKTDGLSFRSPEDRAIALKLVA